MATDKRNLEETNKSKWRNEIEEAGLRLDHLIETTEGNPYAYILITVEKESDGTAVGVQVTGAGMLLAQGLATFLAKDDNASLIQVATHLAVSRLMEEPEKEPIDELITRLQSIFGDK